MIAESQKILQELPEEPGFKKAKKCDMTKEARYTIGQCFSPRIGTREFFHTSVHKPLEIDDMANSVLSQAGEIDPRDKILVNPILVNVSDIENMPKKSITASLEFCKHRNWQPLKKISVLHYVLNVCERHLNVLNEGDVIVLMSDYFSYYDERYVLAMRRGSAYTSFSLFLYELERELTGKEKVLFHRERMW